MLVIFNLDDAVLGGFVQTCGSQSRRFDQRRESLISNV